MVVAPQNGNHICNLNNTREGNNLHGKKIEHSELTITMNKNKRVKKSMQCGSPEHRDPCTIGSK